MKKKSFTSILLEFIASVCAQTIYIPEDNFEYWQDSHHLNGWLTPNYLNTCMN